MPRLFCYSIKKTAKNLLAMSLAVEQILKATGLSLNYIKLL